MGPSAQICPKYQIKDIKSSISKPMKRLKYCIFISGLPVARLFHCHLRSILRKMCLLIKKNIKIKVQFGSFLMFSDLIYQIISVNTTDSNIYVLKPPKNAKNARKLAKNGHFLHFSIKNVKYSYFSTPVWTFVSFLYIIESVDTRNLLIDILVP